MAADDDLFERLFFPSFLSRTTGSGRLSRQTVECVDGLAMGTAGTGLQVFHGIQRCFMCLPGRTSHAVFDNPRVVVVLVRVHKSIVNADIGQLTTQDQRICLQALEQYLEVGAEECGISSLGNQIITLPVRKRG